MRNWSYTSTDNPIEISTVGELLEFIKDLDPTIALNDDFAPVEVCVMVGEQDSTQKYLSVETY